MKDYDNDYESLQVPLTTASAFLVYINITKTTNGSRWMKNIYQVPAIIVRIIKMTAMYIYTYVSTQFLYTIAYFLKLVGLTWLVELSGLKHETKTDVKKVTKALFEVLLIH